MTWAPSLYGTYQLGRWVLGQPPIGGDGVTLAEKMALIWQPLLLGSVLTGTALGVIGCYASRWSWRAMVVWAWRRRQRVGAVTQVIN